MALSLLKSKSMYDLSIDTLARFAAKARLPEKLVLSAGVEMVQKFVDAWAAERDNLPIASQMIETIDRHSRNIELVREITRA